MIDSRPTDCQLVPHFSFIVRVRWGEKRKINGCTGAPDKVWISVEMLRARGLNEGGWLFTSRPTFPVFLKVSEAKSSIKLEVLIFLPQYRTLSFSLFLVVVLVISLFQPEDGIITSRPVGLIQTRNGHEGARNWSRITSEGTNKVREGERKKRKPSIQFPIQSSRQRWLDYEGLTLHGSLIHHC